MCCSKEISSAPAAEALVAMNPKEWKEERQLTASISRNVPRLRPATAVASAPRSAEGSTTRPYTATAATRSDGSTIRPYTATAATRSDGSTTRPYTATAATRSDGSATRPYTATAATRSSSTANSRPPSNESRAERTEARRPAGITTKPEKQQRRPATAAQQQHRRDNAQVTIHAKERPATAQHNSSCARMAATVQRRVGGHAADRHAAHRRTVLDRPATAQQLGARQVDVASSGLPVVGGVQRGVRPSTAFPGAAPSAVPPNPVRQTGRPETAPADTGVTVHATPHDDGAAEAAAVPVKEVSRVALPESKKVTRPMSAYSVSMSRPRRQKEVAVIIDRKPATAQFEEQVSSGLVELCSVVLCGLCCCHKGLCLFLLVLHQLVSLHQDLAASFVTRN